MSTNSAYAARRRTRVAALILALIFGALAFGSWWASRDPLRIHSKEVEGPAIAATEVPDTYRAVYRVESRGGDGPMNLTTEKVWFKRPFLSRIETWKDGERVSLRQSRFGELGSIAKGTGAPLDIAVPPSLASGDLRIDASLIDTVKDRYAVKREQREVYGRRCQVYRYGGPVSAGDITKYTAGSGEYADVCVDHSGIVLEEYWVRDNKLIRRRVATELQVNRPISSRLFKIDIDSSASGIDRGLVKKIDKLPHVEGAVFWTLRGSPEGFKKLGRYAIVISSQALPRSSDPLSAPPTGASTSDVYVRGPDVVVIDQDPSLASLAAMEGRPLRSVKAGRLKDAKLILDARMNEIRGGTPDGSYVRIYGTVPPSELIDLAEQLHPREAT